MDHSRLRRLITGTRVSRPVPKREDPKKIVPTPPPPPASPPQKNSRNFTELIDKNIYIDIEMNLIEIAQKGKTEMINCLNELYFDVKPTNNGIVTIIPVRGRIQHLKKTLSYLFESMEHSGVIADIVIVEHSKEMQCLDILEIYPNISYVWISAETLLFNKCLCHNVGYSVVTNPHLHFHDSDLIPQRDFYKKLSDASKISNVWQCFPARRVQYIDRESSELIFSSRKNLYDIIESPQSYKPGLIGAPGGSLLVERGLFELVGGFDPHFFWAYSIEDQFFWDKVTKYSEIRSIDLELYHLWHEPGWGVNPNQRYEQNIHREFNRNGKPNEYYNVAREYLNDIKDKVNASRGI